jgi:serine/threonine protein kinase
VSDEHRNSTHPGALFADRYRILAEIGRGGMATVYHARDEQLGREVAVKVFRHGLAGAADVKRRQSEVRMLATLVHPSLVTLFDAVSGADGSSALILEYVAGSDLRTLIPRGPVPSGVLAGVGRDISRGLAYIHDRGVVHRDIAPGNILLPRQEEAAHGVDAKLTDLGIAQLAGAEKLTSTGVVIGTAAYMSPEQVQGNPVGPASDVYSLGLVLLEAVTGKRAFDGAAVEAAVARLNRDPEISPELDEEWRDLLAAMTARDPTQRPSAAAAADTLDRLSDTHENWRTRKLPAAAETAATVRLEEAPVASAPDDVETVALTSARNTPLPRSPRRKRGVLLAIPIAVAAALIIVAAAVIPSLNRTTPHDAVTSYPTVPGQLGTHVKQLEHNVSVEQGK